MSSIFLIWLQRHWLECHIKLLKMGRLIVLLAWIRV